MYKKSYVEKVDAVFFYAPTVQDVALEFGITDPEAITAMYEVFKRASNFEKEYAMDDEKYREGYKKGCNDTIEDVISRLDDLSWEIGRLKSY